MQGRVTCAHVAHVVDKWQGGDWQTSCSKNGGHQRGDKRPAPNSVEATAISAEAAPNWAEAPKLADLGLRDMWFRNDHDIGRHHGNGTILVLVLTVVRGTRAMPVMPTGLSDDTRRLGAVCAVSPLSLGRRP